MKNYHRILPSAIICALVSAPSWAGRPIGTDDAGTADKGTCQIESWNVRTRDARALVVEPACGVAEDVEVGMDFTRPSPRNEISKASGIAFKWVPLGLKFDTALGALQGGIKLSTSYEQPAGATWHNTNATALALATLKLGPTLTLHANIGATRDRASRQNGMLGNVALVYTPTEETLLFAETQMNDRKSIFGGTNNTLGGRWWVVKDRFGLDITYSRTADTPNATAWTIGFGWYGFTF